MTTGASLETTLYALLAQPGYRPLRQHELARALHVKSRDRALFRSLLRKGMADGRLVCLRKNRWALPAKDRFIRARISVLPNGGAIATVLSSEDATPQEYFIGRMGLAGAIHGDTALLELVSRRTRMDRSNRVEARVVRVVERSQAQLAGQLQRNRFQWYLIPDHPHIRNNVYLEPPPASLQLEAGLYAVAELDDWVGPDLPLRGRVREILGDSDLPGLSAQMLLKNHQLSKRFDNAVSAAARATPADLSEGDLRGREDCRALLTFTIDPADARDFDDAVSLSPISEGLLLGVHIADVSHFVPIGSTIDREAAQRGNSVYLTGDFVPMLPHYLTSEVCSLRPDVDRLAYTVWITLDEKGRILSHRFAPTVIRSSGRLTYDQVQSHFDQPTSDSVPLHLRAALDQMRSLAREIRERRMRAGALNLAMPEVKCKLNEDGDVQSIHLRGAPEAYQLIEEFMLLANIAVAERLASRRVPMIYRIHDEPAAEQWEAMATALRMLGIHQAVQTPDDINRICKRVEGTPSAYLTNLAILRNLKRAAYSTKHIKHFGLGFPSYTHFTSPIRRYPDLLIHRILKASEANARTPYRHEDIERFALHCSETERNADEAESESLKLKCLEYYGAQMRAGDVGPHPALIVGVLARGVLVDLTESLVRGMIPLHALGEDYFEAFPDQGFVRSRHTKRQLRIGQLVEVELMRIDLTRRRLDLRMVSPRKTANGSDKSSSARSRPAPRQKRGRSRGSS